jgi:hypothetical protein
MGQVLAGARPLRSGKAPTRSPDTPTDQSEPEQHRRPRRRLRHCRGRNHRFLWKLSGGSHRTTATAAWRDNYASTARRRSDDGRKRRRRADCCQWKRLLQADWRQRRRRFEQLGKVRHGHLGRRGGRLTHLGRGRHAPGKRPGMLGLGELGLRARARRTLIEQVSEAFRLVHRGLDDVAAVQTGERKGTSTGKDHGESRDERGRPPAPRTHGSACGA